MFSTICNILAYGLVGLMVLGIIVGCIVFVGGVEYCKYKEAEYAENKMNGQGGKYNA